LAKPSQPRSHRRTVPAGNQAAVARHQIHQTPKRELHRIEVLVNIGVIEFDVVNDGNFGEVMHELRALVEIGRVVFVAFNDEVIAVGDAKTDAEVLHHATDHERWIESCLVDDPRGETRRGRLAVSTRDYQRAPAANEFILQNFWQRSIDETTIQRLFNLWISPGNGIADNNAIGSLTEVLRVVAAHYLDVD